MVGAATPLQCQQQTHNAGQQEEFSKQVELRELLSDRETLLHWVGGLQKKHEDECDYSSDREVDVEAPPPRHIRGEGTALSQVSRVYDEALHQMTYQAMAQQQTQHQKWHQRNLGISVVLREELPLPSG